MSPRTAIRYLLLLVLGLPILQVVFSWVGGLLSAMGDTATAEVLRHVNTAAQVTWLVGLVGLVVMLAVDSLTDPQKQ